MYADRNGDCEFLILACAYDMVRKNTASTAGQGVDGDISVTAQQSRYALDAVDAPASKEVRYQILS